MKPSAKFKIGITAFMLTLLNIAVYAQEKKLDVDINVGKQTHWYSNPLVWVAGAAVFILLLVALLRGKK